MSFTTVTQNGKTVAVISGGEAVLRDTQSALETLMRAKYEAGTSLLAVEQSAVAEPFFVLSTGLAGEMLQKLINYGGRIAIYGDFSAYTSKPLHDFMYESNRGRDVFFVPTLEETLQRLTA
ncbi:MAG: DUF4180 domain-containing protein [Oscillibacter sp.]|nr:DUF4180 domain-containing protein [Oscillibacter sp.]